MGALHLANAVANVVPRPVRRFILDQLGFGKMAMRLASQSTETIKLPNGLTIEFNPLLHWNVTKPEFHEPELLAAMEHHLGQGAVFYDIGANVGLHSLTAAAIVGPTGSVLAFEPADVNLKHLRRNAAQPGVGNIAVHPIALGASDGVMRFDRLGAMSGKLLTDSERGVDPAEVPVRSIDSLVAEGHPFPAVIKVDVEGGEGAVLEGAVETLKRRPVVLCEMHTWVPDGVRRAEAALDRAGYHKTRVAKRTMSGQDEGYHIFAV